MRDLSDLQSSIRDRDSRTYFDEAVKAFQVGAFRSAIVETWVAVSLDIVSKIRYLANRGDLMAKKFIEELDNSIKKNNVQKLQKIENSLLDVAKKLELITHREYKELERLYQDRNVCAHPAFVSPTDVFKPSVEQVRAHLASAVDNSLSLPPVSGRELSRQIISEIQSRIWPYYDETEMYVVDRYLHNSRTSVKRNIVELLVKSSIDLPPLEPNAEVDASTVSKRCRASLNAVNDFDSILLCECIENVIHKRQRAEGFSDSTLMRLIGAIGHFSNTWKALDVPQKSRIRTLIQHSNPEELEVNGAFTSLPIADSDIDQIIKDKLSDYINSNNNLSKLIENMTYGRKNLVIPAIEAVKHAYSFRDAEEKLRIVCLLKSELSLSDLQALGEAVRSNNQSYGAYGTQQFLKNLCEATKLLSGSKIVWETIAKNLHQDYIDRSGLDSDSHYSYQALISFISQTFI